MADHEVVEYRNPIVPGFSPDPSVVFVDGVFFLANSSFHIFPGLPIYASRDLRKWTHIGNGINRPEQLSLERAAMAKMPLDTGHFMIGGGGLFAPTIRHHKGMFYIICTNFLGFEEPYVAQNFIISCTDIWSGNWSDPIYIPFNGIDPSLFFDLDDRVYFQGCYLINRTKQPSCIIKQLEIDIETGKQLSDVREIWGGHARYDTEGPHIYKIGRWYYLLVAEGGTFEHHMLCISRSENIWGPYEDFGGNPILTADGTDEYIQNLGHGELFQDGSGQWWVVGLGVRNENEGEPLGKDSFVAPLGRESFLAPVDWPEGGWPQVQQPKMSFLAKAIKTEEGIPEFVDPRNVDLVYIRTPELSKYSIFQDNSGLLILYPSLNKFSNPTGTSTFVGRRQLSLNSIATATLDVSVLREGVEAGLALYKDQLRHVCLNYEPSSRCVVCRAITLDLDNTVLGHAPVEPLAREVQFKIEAHPTRWVFFTRSIREAKASNIEQWIKVGSIKTWEFCAREMTGPIFGVFAHASDADHTSEAVSFLQFDVEQ